MLNTRRRPYCVIQPHTAQEVSVAMTTLLDVEATGDWHIAVRAGGHNLGYSNNVDNGVTIDLKYLNQTTYDKATNTASLGPGGRWGEVYAELHRLGVIVTGGRDGDVGVGGFLLGGGSSYFIAQHGFGCDSVKNYQVVLTNGSIVNTNASANSDLWQALKGGGSNYGIVTRFDMEALPDKNLSYTRRTMSANYTLQYTDAMVEFTNSQQKNNQDALFGILIHAEGEDVIETVQVNVDGVQDSRAFDNLNKIPTVSAPYETLQPLALAAANSTLSGDAW
jgi:hypothetical protein